MTGPEFTSANEGLRLKSYQDNRGFWTLGRGRHHGIGPGMTCTLTEADSWFDDEDYPAAMMAAAGDLGVAAWAHLDEVRRAALADMAFEMGAERLSGFVHFLAAMRNGDWSLARSEGLDSKWHTQVSTRSNRVVDMILTGRWPA